MEHQDFNIVTFNSKFDKLKLDKEKEKKISQKIVSTENIKIEPPKNLGLLICQARTSKGIKTQKDLSILLGVNILTVQKWENNKCTPSNLEISKIEKTLGVKLPRNKKIKIDN